MPNAYRDVWAAFWGNVTALQQIVIEDFPDGDNEAIAPTRYQVDAIRDLGNRVGALVEGYNVPSLTILDYLLRDTRNIDRYGRHAQEFPALAAA
jgi:hypothetical protein